MTVAKYYLPSGDSISEVGVTPDIVVEETENNFKMIGSNIYNQYAKALFKNQNFKNL